ncbi:MAG: BON domain-containing protein [Pseudomonadota bacterium]
MLNRHRTATEYSKNQTITTQIKQALNKKLGPSEAAKIEVTTYKHVVELSGTVDNSQIIRDAIATTKTVPGVNKIENALLTR